MLKIRLKRVGRRNDPSFRVVVVDARKGPKSNKFVERVGFYDPKTKQRELDGERIEYWMGMGAQVSGTVHNMLVDAGILKGDKKNVLPQKSPVVKEEEQKKEAAPEAAQEGEAAPTADTPADEATEGTDTPVAEEAEAPTSSEDESEPRPESVGEQKETE